MDWVLLLVGVDLAATGFLGWYFLKRIQALEENVKRNSPASRRRKS